MRNKIVVGKSKIHGQGVMADRNFKKGQVVLVFKGREVHWIVCDQQTSLYGPNWIGIGKNKWMDIVAPGVYVNHSCNPNCGIKGKKTLVALKDINKGEEVTVDYSITEIDKLWHMKCRCGSKNCRGIIRSIQFLPKRTYSKYIPYVPTYFIKIYERSGK